MKILGYEIPMGISMSGSDVPRVRDFVENGFTHFELVIPARLPGDAPDLPRTYDADVLAAYAAAAGRGAEERLVEQTQPLADELARFGLCGWSVHLPFGMGWDVAHYVEEERDAVCESLKRVIDLTAKWGVRVYVLHGCLEPVSMEERPVRIARSIRSLRELNEYAARYGARVALEDLPRSCLANNSLETRAMAQAAGNVGICFDVNHLLGEDHASFMKALAAQVITTHLSDYDGVDERHWMPGAGIVPWRMVVEGLMQAGYRGPLLFELGKGPNGPWTAREVLDAICAAVEK